MSEIDLSKYQGMQPDPNHAAVIRQQLEEIHREAAHLKVAPGTRPSRSSARAFAESLLLGANDGTALRIAHDDPIGTLSFLCLADEWSCDLSTVGARTSPLSPTPVLPFQAACEWFLSNLDFGEAAWSPECVKEDDYGFPE